MGLTNYTFPEIKNVTPAFLDLNLTLGIIDKPSLILLNELKLEGGKETVAIIGKSV